jgi:DNA polymerase III epsilon subunit family exonuclease
MMNRLIDEAEFTVFDTETTGLDPKSGDRIVEIAAARIKGDQRLGFFQSLINSGHPVSPEAFNVNRISQDMLDGSPSPADIIPKFMDFAKGSCLISYNAGFDLGFLNNELRILGLGEVKGMPVADILKACRKIIPGLERYALWFVADKLGLKLKQEHRALSDVEMTVAVFQKLKEIMRTKDIVEFDRFLALFSIDQGFLNNINNQKASSIQEALSLGVSLKIKYMSTSSARVTEREVVPKEIKEESGRVYLVGFCCLRREERSFRLENILNLEILHEK